jgi:hypothetical protein
MANQLEEDRVLQQVCQLRAAIQTLNNLPKLGLPDAKLESETICLHDSVQRLARSIQPSLQSLRGTVRGDVADTEYEAKVSFLERSLRAAMLDFDSLTMSKHQVIFSYGP